MNREKRVSLEWLATSNHPLARRFRLLASASSDCPLCSMFFSDKGYCFDEITEDEVEHFQQIADSINLPIRIVRLK